MEEVFLAVWKQELQVHMSVSELRWCSKVYQAEYHAFILFSNFDNTLWSIVMTSCMVAQTIKEMYGVLLENGIRMFCQLNLHEI